MTVDAALHLIRRPAQGHSMRTSASSRLRSHQAHLVAGLLCLITTAAHANGRLPGAMALAIHPTDEKQLLLGLTYGLALSRDGGASWKWICEQHIEGNGGDVDPAIVVTGDGTLVVLSLTNGGVLVSADDGCSFERTMGRLQGQRGVDLTLDPSQSGRVLTLTSTILEVTDAGYPRYRNLVAHSLDHGRSWEVLAELPDDMSAETLEVAASEANRIYVTGTASSDPLQGIIERSDDGGISWKRTTVRLPRGSGSMFVSAIDAKDPDRLWVRVPGRGDIYGVLPARLWLSTDGGASFEQVGDTQGGMFGFAVSPEGDRIAFGGPLDGLFVAPADASAPPSKVADMPVTCLRWRESGLYACSLEPHAPYSLGLAEDPTQGFAPLWLRANTCRDSCTPPSRLEMRCRAPWEEIAPLIGADTPFCDGSASMPDVGDDGSSMPDAGNEAGSDAAASRLDGGDATVIDASPVTQEPIAAARAPSASGCSVALPGFSTRCWLAPALMMLAGWALATRYMALLRPGTFRRTRCPSIRRQTMAMLSPMGSRSGRRALDLSIPLVPFLDLLLCCLMFLLVTAVWNQLGRIETAQRVPGSGEVADVAERIRLMLAVRKDGYELASTLGERQWLDGYDADALMAALRTRSALGDQRWNLTVSAEDGVAYEQLITAMDVALAAGFHAIDVSDTAQ
jgi:biopolymer transport protein ExbD